MKSSLFKLAMACYIAFCTQAVASHPTCRDQIIIGVTPITGVEKPSPNVYYSSVIQAEKYTKTIASTCKDYNISVIILPHDINRVQDYLNLVDGLVLVGGLLKSEEEYQLQEYMTNIAMGQYVKKHHPQNPEYDNIFEFDLARGGRKSKIPTLGIDAGMHMMALAGGIPIGMVSKIKNSAVQHGSHNIMHYHDVKIIKNTTLMASIDQEIVKTVPSLHVKAVQPFNTQSMMVSASSEDGVIEAIETKNRDLFFVGIQWHPEEDQSNGPMYNIIRTFCKMVVTKNAAMQKLMKKEESKSPIRMFEEDAKKLAEKADAAKIAEKKELSNRQNTFKKRGTYSPVQG